MRRLLTSTIATLLLVSGCAWQQTTRTGFLDEAASSATPLRPDPADADRLVARALPGRVAAYDSFIIDKVVFRTGPAAPDAAQQAVLDDLEKTYADALDEAFGQRLRSAGKAGPGVLRVRAAITGYERANVALNVVTLGLIGPVSAGGAATEAEIVDSLTGERIAGLATHNNGTPWMGGPIGYYTQHGHARRALVRQAKELADTVIPQPTDRS